MIIAIGAPGRLRRSLARQFRRLGWEHRWVDNAEQLSITATEADTVACLVSADAEPQKTTRTARYVLQNSVLSAIPLDYATGLEPEHRQFREQDEYADDIFISPVLLAEPSPYSLYAASLERFEQKCGLRDYLDLYQLIASVVQRDVAGDVTEFGSYKGHSGWLIAATLRALGSDKCLYMFDTFESFPDESSGIDRFWSGTHLVHLDEVRAKLADMPSARLVPGEFGTTFPASGIDQISLAYIDCDSHRAVSYLAGALYEDHLTPGGMMVFEDYGHPALLGCRVAVHDYFDGRTDCVRFFSQFSGLYIVLKL